MSDTAELYAAMRQNSATRRAENRSKSATLLVESGLSFHSNNGGVHLTVNSDGVVVDFWPGTGKWTVRKTKKSGRGVFNLIKFYKGKDVKAESRASF